MLIKMKPKLTFFTLILVVVTAVFGIAGINIIKAVYLNEIHTVQNIAGKVIAAAPETERLFMEALNGRGKEDAAAGAEILSHYGYDDKEKIEENALYRRIAFYLAVALAMFFGLLLMFMYAFLCAADRRVKKQEEGILSILDSCLSDDYAFINEPERLKGLDNPLFADTLVKLGNKLKLKTAQLKEEKDNTKVLVTDISHQLKTPISALKACFALYTEAEDVADEEEFLQRCRMQINNVETLAHVLIQISRLETNMITLTIEPVSLVEILAGAVNAVYYKAKKKHISIETEEFEDLKLNLDKKWTIEAFANILDNSVKYSPEGTQISIRARKLYNYVRVEIEDNGIGIPREEQSKIFKRFYRGNADEVKREEGCGVGMYLTRKILEDEAGTIFVRSQERRGSIFCINLSLL